MGLPDDALESLPARAAADLNREGVRQVDDGKVPERALLFIVVEKPVSQQGIAQRAGVGPVARVRGLGAPTRQVVRQWPRWLSTRPLHPAEPGVRQSGPSAGVAPVRTSDVRKAISKDWETLTGEPRQLEQSPRAVDTQRWCDSRRIDKTGSQASFGRSLGHALIMGGPATGASHRSGTSRAGDLQLLAAGNNGLRECGRTPEGRTHEHRMEFANQGRRQDPKDLLDEGLIWEGAAIEKC